MIVSAIKLQCKDSASVSRGRRMSRTRTVKRGQASLAMFRVIARVAEPRVSAPLSGVNQGDKIRKCRGFIIV